MKSSRDLYQYIMKKWTDTDFLQDHFLSKKSILFHMMKDSFVEQLDNMVHEEDYTCQSVYSLCEEILMDLWDHSPPENPLFYIYQFTLSKSFPHAVEISLVKRFDSGCILFLEAQADKAAGLQWQSIL